MFVLLAVKCLGMGTALCAPSLSLARSTLWSMNGSYIFEPLSQKWTKPHSYTVLPVRLNIKQVLDN